MKSVVWGLWLCLTWTALAQVNADLVLRNGKIWTVSLYHAKHNTGIDLSEIAKKYNGGGHRGACGFT